MEADNLYALISVALGLGMLHALDADHIAAVSGMASTRATFADSLRFCLRWSFGHGLTVLLLGAAVLLLGMAIPVALSHYAEEAVGVVLIGIGAYVLWDLLGDKTRLPVRRSAGRHAQGAMLVGVLHGAAGSAPLLALLPLSAQSRPLFGLSYLLLFGCGVLLSMLLFGGALGMLFRRLAAANERSLRLLRFCVAAASIGLGAYLVQRAI